MVKIIILMIIIILILTLILMLIKLILNSKLKYITPKMRHIYCIYNVVYVI